MASVADRLLIGTLIVGATSAVNFGCSGSSTQPPPVIVVTLSPRASSLQAGTTAQFVASASDSSDSGINWTVTCSAAPCGSISPATTANGAATTYTAPSKARAGDLTVTVTAASVANSAAAASATIKVVGIVISITPGDGTIDAAGTQQYAANVANDPSGQGVEWNLYDHEGPGTGTILCPDLCGIVAPNTTASGALMTYKAPVKNFGLGMFLVATSLTDAGASSTVEIFVQSVSLAVAPTSAKVAVNGTQQFTPSVTHDAANGGVTWALKQGGAPCSPGCGTLGSTQTANGVPVTYTAPATVPPLPLAMLIEISVTDPTAQASVPITITTPNGVACGLGSGSEALLKGQYTFVLQGFDGTGVGVIGGSFTADGMGNIATGEIDTNPGHFSILATGSSYSVGPDHHGCLSLADELGAVRFFRVAIGGVNSNGVATTGHETELGDSGLDARTSGVMRLQDPSSFEAVQFKGSYAVGFVGAYANGDRFAAAGTFTSDGASTLTGGTFDFNNIGATASNVVLQPGTFTCCSPNGRGTLQITAGTFSTTSNPAFYMISSTELLLVSSAQPFYTGQAVAIPSGTSFTASSLAGMAVFRTTAGLTSSQPIVDIGTASADGSGSVIVKDSKNAGGTFTTGNNTLTYSVASNGRVTFNGGSDPPPVLYLYGQNQGFLIGTGTTVEFGVLEPQATGPFSNASLSGGYTLGTENPSLFDVTMESGVATSDGAGNLAETLDQVNSYTGLIQSQTLNANYSIATDGTGNFGSNTTAILISGDKLVFIDNTNATPTVTVVEK